MIVCPSKEILGRFDARYNFGAIRSSLSAAYVRLCANVRQQQFVGDISIIFPCSFAVGITQQYGIYVLLG